MSMNLEDLQFTEIGRPTKKEMICCENLTLDDLGSQSEQSLFSETEIKLENDLTTCVVSESDNRDKVTFEHELIDNKTEEESGLKKIDFKHDSDDSECDCENLITTTETKHDTSCQKPSTPRTTPNWRSATGGKKDQNSVCENILYEDTSVHNNLVTTHTREEDYQCSVYEKLFTTQSNLTQGLIIQHSGENNVNNHYQCSVCKKVFASNSKAKAHMVTHRGEKKYQCAVCKKFFSSRCYMKQHMVIHTGESNYQCSVCKKIFICSYNLKQHMDYHVLLGITW